ncbi:MAG TPA: sugar ABC transporter permease [Thermomicrobiales bacterium]|nr:sugar ABC transporter permease [Thermomicrobiales bacterium]
MRLTLERRRWIWAYIFILVPFLFFLSIRIGPTLYAFWVSLHQWDPIALDRPFIGIENYRALVDDAVFWAAMRNTWIYVLVGVPVSLIISLAIAMGLQQLMRYVGFYRVLYFVPYVTSLVAVGWVWRWMYMPNGLFNDVLGSVGLGPYTFLGSPDTAIYAIIATTIWQGLGFQVIIFLAGLESIPSDYQEAAAVDGATAWQRFLNITIPLLNPTLVFLIVTGVISNLQVFTQIRAMSSQGTGGPLNSTISIVLYVYQQAFQSLPAKMGYASAMTVVLFVMILAITIVQLKVLSRNNNEY